MSAESEDVVGESFQSASEDGDCSDKDFHSPVSQRGTEASESPSPPNDHSTLKQTNASQSVESPAEGSVGAACIVEELSSVQAPGETPGAVPITDACEPAIASGTAEAAGDTLETADPQVLLSEAEECKSRGNDLFKQGKHTEAIEEYEKALDIAPPDASQRAIYFANKAACHLGLQEYKACIECCSAALRVDPEYLKAIRRRMAAHEHLDELENALADAKKIVELDPADKKTAHSVSKWTPIVAERQEKMKEEVLGKLKDLGNSVLGNFGMSLDNFKMDKDPNTGGYSIRFEQ